MKEQDMEWEKIIVNDISDKGFISKLLKNHIIQYEKKNEQSDLKKWAQNLNGHSSKGHTEGQ